MDKRYLTVEEFARELAARGVTFSERTIRLWVKEGRIKAVRPGRRAWYIPEDELDRVLRGEAGSGRLPLALVHT